MHILFNDQGTPLMLSSTKIYGETKGMPSAKEIHKRALLCPYDIEAPRTSLSGTYTLLPWGFRSEQLPLGTLFSVSLPSRCSS